MQEPQEIKDIRNLIKELRKDIEDASDEIRKQEKIKHDTLLVLKEAELRHDMLIEKYKGLIF